ncbi:MAG: hypothetical protein FWG68_05725 [Defluviitaleaceae bacterium]|nr:hypothetical protein [Defluviitaleaceae bacterium]
MQISQLTRTQPTPRVQANQTAAPANATNNAITVQDTVEISGQPAANNNNNTNNTQGARRYTADISRMREIWTDHERHVESFRRLVQTLLNRQADASNAAGTPWDFNNPDLMVNIDEATRTAAQEAIGEGGPFSVEAVATRLLDFAVAISGGDPERISVLRNAVERGFAAAERQWGGALPDISQQTREAVMNGFDQWQQSGSASSITLLNRD